MTRDRLSICIVGINYAPENTGIAPYTTGLATGLAQRGHRVEVLTGQPHYPQWRRRAGYGRFRSAEEIDGIRVRRFRHYIPRHHSTVRRAAMELSFGCQVTTAGWSRPDVLVCVSPPLLTSTMVTCRRALNKHRPALGVIVHDLYSRAATELSGQRGLSARAVTALESFATRRADGAVVIHEGFAADLIDKLGVEANRVREIRNWTHIATASDDDALGFRRRQGWRDDETIVLHAGNMGSKQGLENVIDAARLADESDSAIRFVLLGDGHQRAHLERLAQGGKHIEFIDPVPETEFPAALRAADILLVNEAPGVAQMAMPSKLTSYFSAGKPILAATDANGFTAAEIAGAAAGIRIPTARPDLLLDAVSRLASDPDLVERLGAAGRRYCELTTSATEAIDRYEDWLYDLVASRAQ